MKTKTIVQSVHNANQSWYLSEILQYQDKKLRLEIRKNAYDTQSYGKIELWTGTQWSEVHAIPGPLLKTQASYVQKETTANAFNVDRTELLRVAEFVISDCKGF